jgi:hypothetical protein
MTTEQQEARAELNAELNRRNEAKAFVRQFSDFVNNMGRPEKEAIEIMGREHRTIQQNMTRFCVRWLEHLAKQSEFDGRNEASVELAKKFVNAVPERHLPFI